jgi:O-antigen biosynthesis protein WbqP
MAKRIFDILFSVLLLFVFFIPIIIIAFAVKVGSKGPIIYWSDRVGIKNRIFKMPKFRTMKTDAPAVASHLLGNPDQYLTPPGRILRKLSVDEIPQLWSILRGDMSFVGPRPALFNQDDLIKLRTERGIHRLIPGVTGWAQVNGRDEMLIPVKVEYDEYYLQKRSFAFDMKILCITFLKVFQREGVTH